MSEPNSFSEIWETFLADVAVHPECDQFWESAAEDGDLAYTFLFLWLLGYQSSAGLNPKIYPKLKARLGDYIAESKTEVEGRE